MPKHPEKRGIMTCTRRNIAYAAAFMAIWIAALALATALLHPAITGSLSTAPASMRLALEALSLASVAVPTDLCQDFGHASSRNQAAIGMTSGLGSVLSKKAAMASAGTL